MATATTERPKAGTTTRAKPSPPKPKRQPKPGAATKRPANLKRAVQQPKGRVPTRDEIRRGRREWGIEAFIKKAKVVGVRPAQRGRVVHAATSTSAEQTLCGTAMKWAGGVEQEKDNPVDCLWCLCRIEDAP